MMERAVVLASSSAALEFAMGLAAQGVAVRVVATCSEAHLCRPVLAAPGEASELERAWGAVTPVDWDPMLVFGGRQIPVPSRRRSLARALDVGGMALLFDLLRELGRSSPDARSWCLSRFGSSVTWTLSSYLAKRYGRPVEALPLELVRYTLDQPVWRRWYRPVGLGAERFEVQRECILQAGGELLTDVAVEGLEMGNGRPLSLLTEFGREVLEGELYTDCSSSYIRGLAGDSGDSFTYDMRFGFQVSGEAKEWLEVVDASCPAWRVVMDAAQGTAWVTSRLDAGRIGRRLAESLAPLGAHEVTLLQSRRYSPWLPMPSGVRDVDLGRSPVDRVNLALALAGGETDPGARLLGEDERWSFLAR